MEKRTFRLKGVTDRITQTLLDNARTGHVTITNIGFDALGRRCSVKLNGQTQYLHVGEVPPDHQEWIQQLRGVSNLMGAARVLGGGWSIQVPGRVKQEIARYGDYESIPQHHLTAVTQGDYDAIRLNCGLEITLELGIPPVHNALSL